MCIVRPAAERKLLRPQKIHVYLWELITWFGGKCLVGAGDLWVRPGRIAHWDMKYIVGQAAWWSNARDPWQYVTSMWSVRIFLATPMIRGEACKNLCAPRP